MVAEQDLDSRQRPGVHYHAAWREHGRAAVEYVDYLYWLVDFVALGNADIYAVGEQQGIEAVAATADIRRHVEIFLGHVAQAIHFKALGCFEHRVGEMHHVAHYDRQVAVQVGHAAAEGRCHVGRHLEVLKVDAVVGGIHHVGPALGRDGLVGLVRLNLPGHPAQGLLAQACQQRRVVPEEAGITLYQHQVLS